MEVRELWDVQAQIQVAHFYVMGANALIGAYYILSLPSRYLDLTQVTGPNLPLQLLSLALMGVYYSLESVTTFLFCTGGDTETCHFLVHHVLTLLLLVLSTSFNLINAVLNLIMLTHGLMSVAYYYAPFICTVFCQWYTTVSLGALLHAAAMVLTARSGRLRVVYLAGLGLMLSLIVNNAITPQLVQLCATESFSRADWMLLVFLHVLGGGVLSLLLWRHSSRKDELPIPIHLKA
jgi:hypothetical protein